MTLALPYALAKARHRRRQVKRRLDAAERVLRERSGEQVLDLHLIEELDPVSAFLIVGRSASLCRLYRSSAGQSGVPPREWIEQALRETAAR